MMTMEGLGGRLKIKLKLKTVNGSSLSSCKHRDKVESAGNISCSNDPESFNLDSSVRFANDVRKRFAENPQTYREFLGAIIDYSRGNYKDTKNLCIKIVDLFFGQANLIHQFKLFFNDRDEELRREIERSIGFAIDDRMCEIEVLRCNLRTSIECAEDALRLPPSELLDFVENKFVGIKLMGIKRLYGEWSEELTECLRKDPQRALPVLLVRLREKERVVSMLRSAALQFLGQFHALNSKRGVKRKLILD